MKNFSTRLIAAMALLAMSYFFKVSVEGLWQQPQRSAVYGLDNSFYYFWLRSAFMERPFDFRQSAEVTPTMPDRLRQSYLHSTPTPAGKLANKYGVGWALSGVPSFLVADVLVYSANGVGITTFPRNGFSAVYQFFVLTGQWTFAVMSLFLAWRIVCRWVPPEEAAQGVLLCWLGSFLLVYQTWLLSMSHSLSFFAVTWAYWASLRLSEGRAGRMMWIQVGLACGLAVITRYQTAVYLLFPAVVSLRELVRWGMQARQGFAFATVAGTGMVLLQLFAWKLIYGSWLVDSYEGEGFQFFHPHFLEVLFSPFHGLFYWSPVLVLGVLGFLTWAWRGGVAAWTWTLSFLGMLWVNAAWDGWHFGASYGSRGFEGCVLFFMLGTAWLLYKCRGWMKVSLLALLMALAMANIALSHSALWGHTTLERPVTHAEMLRNILDDLLQRN